MDEASPDTEPRVQPTCSSCRFFEPPSLRCRFNVPNEEGDHPPTQKHKWCGQHRTSDADLMDTVLGNIKKGVDLEVLEELQTLLPSGSMMHGDWAYMDSCLQNLPAGVNGYLLVLFPRKEIAAQVQELLRELAPRKEDAAAPPEGDGS